MGNRWRKWLVAVAVVASAAMAGNANAQGSVSLQVFYDELQPYGTWVDHGRYGYVWMPNTGGDFVPYGSNGYWVQTGYGNTWVSNYSWGWAPFHYGRWFYDDFYGWLWVPDTTWGPAWVTWRSGGGYYGWAPLMPGLSISMNVGYYNSIPNHYWNFVPYRYVMYRQVYRHCVPRPRVVNVIQNTTVIVNNNYYDNQGPSGGRDRPDSREREAYFTGPSRSEIEKRNGERIPVYDVHDRNSPGHTEVSRSSVSLYKPNVEQTTRTRALPAQFTRDDERGRENISQIRSTQLGEQRSRESFDGNRDATRRSEGSDPGHSSPERMLKKNEPSEGTPRDIDDLRRGLRSPANGERSADEPERNNNRRENLDRLGRDTEFNTMQQQREADLLRRQQSDVQRRQQQQQPQGDDQLQRFREQRQQEQRLQEEQGQQRKLQEQRQEQLKRSDQRELNEQKLQQRQPTQQRQSRPVDELQQPKQRQYEAPRQSPSRQQPPSQQQGQSQQRTVPSRQQQFAPQQRQPGQPRVSSPSRGSSTNQQRPNASRSSSSQR